MTRINVYAEEMTTETEIVTKVVTDNEFGTRTFYGVRFYLKSPPELHHSAEDDDRSAITFWVPWTKEGGYDLSVLTSLSIQLDARLDEIDTMISEDAVSP